MIETRKAIGTSSRLYVFVKILIFYGIAYNNIIINKTFSLPTLYAYMILPSNLWINGSRSMNNIGKRKNIMKLDDVVNHDDCYRLGDVNLSQKWRSLVEQKQVSAKTTFVSSSSSGEEDAVVEVEYGVYYDESKDQYLEFIEQTNKIDDTVSHSNNNKLKEMNQILKDSDGRPIVRTLGAYAAQLQLVRTLRPPPSVGFVPEMMSATPPPYDAQTDSFVKEGPFSLFQRPLVSSIPLGTNSTNHAWDIYHNISPVDVRGHYLLIPTLSNPNNNWRGQRLTQQDAMDLCQLASTMSSNLLILYNSVGGGASQNHIHCHIWPRVPLAFSSKHTHNNNNHQSLVYPVQQAEPSSPIISLGKNTSACSLNYPCCCVRLESDDVYELGLALATVLKLLKDDCQDAIHNVAFFSSSSQQPNLVQVYIFCRSRQQSPNILPYSKLGVSEMLGLFHVKTMKELHFLTTNITTTTSNFTPQHNYNNPMEQSLQDVSLEPKQYIWNMIHNKLSLTFQNIK